MSKRVPIKPLPPDVPTLPDGYVYSAFVGEIAYSDYYCVDVLKPREGKRGYGQSLVQTNMSVKAAQESDMTGEEIVAKLCAGAFDLLEKRLRADTFGDYVGVHE